MLRIFNRESPPRKVLLPKTILLPDEGISSVPLNTLEYGISDLFAFLFDGYVYVTGTPFGHWTESNELPLIRTIKKIPSVFNYFLRSIDLQGWVEDDDSILIDDIRIADDIKIFAPEIIKYGKLYYMFSSFEEEGKRTIRVDCSDSPLGPYDPYLTLGHGDYPHPYIDTDGRLNFLHGVIRKSMLGQMSSLAVERDRNIRFYRLKGESDLLISQAIISNTLEHHNDSYSTLRILQLGHSNFLAGLF